MRTKDTDMLIYKAKNGELFIEIKGLISYLRGMVCENNLEKQTVTHIELDMQKLHDKYYEK